MRKYQIYSTNNSGDLYYFMVHINKLVGIFLEKIGQHNDRQVFYLSTRQIDWADQLPTNNWVVLPIGHNKDIDLIITIAKKCLEKNVSYICATGQQSSLIHDTFDHFIVQNKIDKGESLASPDDFEYSPLTTCDNDIDEEFWFSLTPAFHPYTDITKVVCLDMTETGVREKLVDLLTKINLGWLPPDSKVEK